MHEVSHNIPEWIEAHRKFFLPPTCSKLLHGDGQLKVLFVGGANERRDYHVEEGEELYYMVTGMMCLRIQNRGKFEQLVIREGEMFLLPARVPHSPQRYHNSVGLVIQRERLPHEKDGLRFLREDTTELFFERWFHCDNVETDFKPIIREYLQSGRHHQDVGKTSALSSEEDIESSRFWPNFQAQICPPVHLSTWLQENRADLERDGRKSLYDARYQTEATVFRRGTHRCTHEHSETWLWQLEGSSVVRTDGAEYALSKGRSLLVKQNSPHEIVLAGGDDAVLLSVTMDPTKASGSGDAAASSTAQGGR